MCRLSGYNDQYGSRIGMDAGRGCLWSNRCDLIKIVASVLRRSRWNLAPLG